MVRRWDLLLSLVCAVLVVGWNVSRFIGVEPSPRIRETLDFLPEPKVARMLALGQQATLGKAMLIDSFPYFQHQILVQNDQGGFRRLYETLIELDPNFIDFYLKGGTAIGGVIGDLAGEVAILQRGLLHHPSNTKLWLYLVSVLEVSFQLGDRQPDVLLAMLEQWRQAELASGSGLEALPGDWLRNVRARRDLGIAEASYWGQQLFHLQDNPDTPQALVVQDNMRRGLARRQERRLQALVDSCTALDGDRPMTLTDCLRTEAIQGIYELPSDATHATQPFARDEEGRWSLRRDPFGYPWTLQGDRVISLGLERERFRAVLGEWNARYRQASRDGGRWAEDLAEALVMAEGDADRVPRGGVVQLRDGFMQVAYGDEAAAEPWTVTELLQAAGMIE